jgi:energy-coupling factor transporter ATP-binding protein EcfA2
MSRLKAGRISEVYAWASQLASESRDSSWIAHWYVWPQAVRQIYRHLKTAEGSIIGLVGLQGSGKTSALTAITMALMAEESLDYKKQFGKEPDSNHEYSSVFFKWRRYNELMPLLLGGRHEISSSFLREYKAGLLEQLIAHRVPLTKELLDNPQSLNLAWAEPRFSKVALRQVRQSAWLGMLREKRTILIDTPDYSKTDRRKMSSDLNEICWLWDALCHRVSLSGSPKPNLIIAIQAEMFQVHFFFDKMERVELTPLPPNSLVEAYRKRFKETEPFTEEALLKLASMSRGIFRRFLRYITITLDLWQSRKRKPHSIGPELVSEAISTKRLAEDMDLELADLFPKHSDLRLQAVRLLMHLESSGPTKQSQVADDLDLEPYVLSRLLTKLELHKYIVRRREGADKIVSPTHDQRVDSTKKTALAPTP